jgi:type IV secretion system protein TrbF
MKNPFKRESVSYKSEDVLTPYQRAQQEWDLRIGSSRLQAKNWRILAILSLLAAVLLTIVIIFILTNRKEHIYIAEVTKEGKVINVSPLLVQYQPSEAQKEYFIAHFIELTRSIPLDPVLAKKNWLTAYNFLNSRGAERLNYYFKQGNPIALLGKKTITVQIADINPISPSTLNVNWTEVTINTNGQEEAKKNYSGIFTIAIKQPIKNEEILRNPLGLRIIDFSIKAKETK